MEAIRILKFGGSSVATIAKIKHVAEIIKTHMNRGEQVVVVLSAMHGQTNHLVSLAQSLSSKPSSYELDALMATGEQVSTALLAIALQEDGVLCRSYNAYQLEITTDGLPQKARIKSLNIGVLRESIQRGIVPIVAGFQGVDKANRTTTLGRGGSDTTAVILAAALKAQECMIYTDVEGVYSADPNIVPQAQLLAKVSATDMMSLSSLGAKVLQLTAIEIADRYEVPLRILSTFNPGDGTLVEYNQKGVAMNKVTGIAIERDHVFCSISGIMITQIFVNDLFAHFFNQNIPIDMASSHITDQCGDNYVRFATRHEYGDRIEAEIKEFIESKPTQEYSIDIRKDVGKLSVIGFAGYASGEVLHIVCREMLCQGIDIMCFYGSGLNLSVLVEIELIDVGARSLHRAFNLDLELNTCENVPKTS